MCSRPQITFGLVFYWYGSGALKHHLSFGDTYLSSLNHQQVSATEPLSESLLQVVIHMRRLNTN